MSQDPAAKNRKLESGHGPASPQLAPDVITFTPIAGGAPLQINVANDASYQVIYGSGSTTPGQVYWTNADIADAGLFLWYDGYVIGPDFSNHPSGSASNYYDVWTPAAQGAVTGSGTPGDPWTIETNVVHQPSGTSLTTRNSYVDGENYFRVDWDICLPQAAQVSTFLAADYYLQGSDNGYGLYDADTGSVGGYNYAHDWFQIFTPIRPSSHYFEGRYWEVWDNIGYAGTAGPGFNDTINTDLIDNGAGLQWDMYVNGCATVSAFWSFGETPTIPPVVPPYEETCGYVLWQTTLPLSTAGTADFSEVAGTLDTTGQLLLWGQASSATGQPFATAQYPFQVFDRDTSLTLETDRDVYRPGETVEVSGQVVNTSGLTQNMVLQVTDGQGVILEESLTLDANESYSYATSVEATSDLVLVATAANATATAAPTVADPQVDASFQAPDVVGRTSFDVVLELSNTGLVPANLQAEVAGQAEPDFTLQPGETRQIYRTVQTNQDTVVAATVSGDASYDFSHPVVQGELTTLSLDVPPDPLWTGTVAVAYSLDNVGVLPADTPLDI
ncbi:MAG: hypothetical protein KDI03_21430, partial [Anaerolineae bacterium]|nr:hypothetical protein [Anaerolineae bacterium]